MKIISVVTQMEAAGAQRVAYLLHQHFQEAGHASKLVFLYTKRPAYEGLPNVSSVCGHPPSASDYTRIAGRLAALLRVEKPDVLITHSHYSNILGQSIGLLCGLRKRIAVNHSTDNLYPRAARVIDKLCGVAGVYEHIVAVSGAVGASLDGYPRAYRQRLKVIPNGASVTTIRRTGSVTRTEFSIPLDVPVLVTIGRLSKMKNHAFLLHLLRFLPNVHLAIVGEGEERPFLTSLAGDLGIRSRVHLLGEQTSETAHSIVKACDLFVFPSMTGEGMPMALIEAMLLGMPIIASDIPACKSILGDAGISLPIDDPDAWATTVEELLYHRPSAQKLGELAKNHADVFAPECMARKYLELGYVA